MEQRYEMEISEEVAVERELNHLFEVTLRLECELEAVFSRN